MPHANKMRNRNDGTVRHDPLNLVCIVCAKCLQCVMGETMALLMPQLFHFVCQESQFQQSGVVGNGLAGQSQGGAGTAQEGAGARSGPQCRPRAGGGDPSQSRPPHCRAAEEY